MTSIKKPMTRLGKMLSLMTPFKKKAANPENTLTYQPVDDLFDNNNYIASLIPKAKNNFRNEVMNNPYALKIFLEDERSIKFLTALSNTHINLFFYTLGKENVLQTYLNAPEADETSWVIAQALCKMGEAPKTKFLLRPNCIPLLMSKGHTDANALFAAIIDNLSNEKIIQILKTDGIIRALCEQGFYDDVVQMIDRLDTHNQIRLYTQNDVALSIIESGGANEIMKKIKKMFPMQQATVLTLDGVADALSDIVFEGDVKELIERLTYKGFIDANGKSQVIPPLPEDISEEDKAKMEALDAIQAPRPLESFLLKRGHASGSPPPAP